MSSKLALCLGLPLTLALGTARAAEPAEPVSVAPDASDGLSKKERRAQEKAERKAEKARRKAERRGELPADEDEPELVEDAVAVDVPDEGRWAWVDAMGGEIPTDDQIEAIEEIQAQHLSEQELIDDLSGRAAPVDFYRDPIIALATDPLLLDLVDAAEFDIPMETNEWVAKWVRYFNQGRGRQYFERWLERATRYEAWMRTGLEEVGLPGDLVYLSMIESGYSNQAYSRAAAAGMWQFMTKTGLEMGLRIDWWVDERRDPEASLEAAITYLAQLRETFGDWRLAWAAYNGGPGRVNKAIGRAGSRDFWTLANGPYLHPETDNYVPKIMAAAIIAKHPDRYGFTLPKGGDPLAYDKAKVDGSVELEVLAKCAGVTIEEIRELNPALRRFATPPEGYEVRVPKGKRDAFLAALEAIPVEERLTVIRHRVRRGDTLAIIAQRYGSTVAEIRRANGLRSVNRIAVGWTLVIPQTGGASKKEEPDKTKANDKTVHVVRRGDTLSGIAAEHSLDEATLRSYNGITDDQSILVGQRLRLTEPGPEPEQTGPVHTVRYGETLGGIAKRYSVPLSEVMELNGIKNAWKIEVGQPIRLPVDARVKPAPRLARYHTVRRGETLSHIARKYRVTVKGLMRLNRLSDPSLIRAGQRLRLVGDPPKSRPAREKVWATHTVRRGESLAKIASRYGCSVADLMGWNELSDTTIQPGQTLRVKK
ncbi:MAG: LysM peptidoglycan-binding domain-containing protein [Myxococcota bacterium]